MLIFIVCIRGKSEKRHVSCYQPQLVFTFYYNSQAALVPPQAFHDCRVSTRDPASTSPGNTSKFKAEGHEAFGSRSFAYISRNIRPNDMEIAKRITLKNIFACPFLR